MGPDCSSRWAALPPARAASLLGPATLHRRAPGRGSHWTRCQLCPGVGSDIRRTMRRPRAALRGPDWASGPVCDSPWTQNTWQPPVTPRTQSACQPLSDEAGTPWSQSPSCSRGEAARDSSRVPSSAARLGTTRGHGRDVWRGGVVGPGPDRAARGRPGQLPHGRPLQNALQLPARGAALRGTDLDGRALPGRLGPLLHRTFLQNAFQAAIRGTDLGIICGRDHVLSTFGWLSSFVRL